MLNFFDIPHRIIQVNPDNPNDTVRICSSEFGNLSIGHNGPTWPVPGTETDLLYASFIHELDQLIWAAVSRHQFRVGMALSQESTCLGNVFLSNQVSFRRFHINILNGAHTPGPPIGFAQTSMIG